MKFTVKKPVEIEIKTIRVVAPVKYDDEDMPYDFPFRKDNVWDVLIDVDTGKIKDWPAGVEFDLHMKVTDGGKYYLMDGSGNVVGEIEENYVPNGIIPGSYGDYIEIAIATDGTITNWPKKPDVSEFFAEES